MEKIIYFIRAVLSKAIKELPVRAGLPTVRGMVKSLNSHWFALSIFELQTIPNGVYIISDK